MMNMKLRKTLEFMDNACFGLNVASYVLISVVFGVLLGWFPIELGTTGFIMVVTSVFWLAVRKGVRTILARSGE